MSYQCFTGKNVGKLWLSLCEFSLLGSRGLFEHADWFILLPNGESLSFSAAAAAAAAGCVAQGVFKKRGGGFREDF